MCGSIPSGTQFSTFDVTSFQSNKCLWGCPINICSNQKEKPIQVGNNASSSDHVKVKWLSSMNKKMSLVALGTGMGIGFGGVVVMFIVWERARCWVLGSTPKKPQVHYGLYRLPA